MIWKNQSIQMFSIISILATIVSSVSLPGVVPTDYTEGERVELHVNVLSSLKKSVLPFDYYYEQFHFCRPEEGAIQQTQSIGSMLFGDRLFNSPFELYMLKNQTCKKTCEAQIPADDAKFINQAIQETYLLSWMVDGLPAAQKSNTGMEHASIGFHLGQRIGRINPSTNEMEVMSLLNNHFEIYIQYHERKDKKYRVVGVFVNPTSTQFDTCDRKEKDMGMALSETDMNSVTYTYDVYWIPSEIEWGSRWDHYLYSTDNKIHWFSAMVSGILLQALRRDIIRYNQVDFEDSQEQFGWKMVHGDVFRPPIHRMILSVLIGNGFQLLFMSVVTIVIAALGFLSPSNRGALATAMIILYFLFSCVSGYTSARVYKMCGGQRWRQNMLMTTLLVPG
ncbi:hypothetical protein HDV02_003876 [Globomyces sp. JEL0801]|nr:hypothetical protein HDV02_003876 [Globomyces sp. JEL0801]